MVITSRPSLGEAAPLPDKTIPKVINFPTPIAGAPKEPKENPEDTLRDAIKTLREGEYTKVLVVMWDDEEVPLPTLQWSRSIPIAEILAILVIAKDIFLHPWRLKT